MSFREHNVIPIYHFRLNCARVVCPPIIGLCSNSDPEEWYLHWSTFYNLQRGSLSRNTLCSATGWQLETCPSTASKRDVAGFQTSDRVLPRMCGIRGLLRSPFNPYKADFDQGDQIGYDVSEDCLALNVVRPSGYEGQSLPVAVWIHGGGYVMGGATDRRYNLSFIVQNSVAIGKPIVAVSVAYRLSGWGFLDSKEVRAAGVTNIGMQDQRQALYWIQENIAAFGGDPKKVTIWGESAGAGSVGIHLIAYGGRNDGLFSGAICESGNSILLGTPNYNVTDGQLIYNNITAAVGCSGNPDTLACLRTVSYDSLNTALNRSFSFYPYNDGSLIQGSQYDQLTTGKFVKVPLLSGANTDEGSAFGPRGINNDTAFAAYLASTGGKTPLNASTVSTLQAVYPNLPAVSDVLYNVPLNYQFNTTYGTQYRRAVAFGGDFAFHAARRLQCQSWSAQNVSAFCYRFNVVPYPLDKLIGATHFQEVRKNSVPDHSC